MSRFLDKYRDLHKLVFRENYESFKEEFSELLHSEHLLNIRKYLVGGDGVEDIRGLLSEIIFGPFRVENSITRWVFEEWKERDPDISHIINTQLITKVITGHSSVENLNLLLEYGLNPEYISERGRNLFHIFSYLPHIHSIAQNLHTSRCQKLLNQIDDDGRTILSKVIASRASFEFITYLRLLGADPYMLDEKGLSPIDYASQIGNYTRKKSVLEALTRSLEDHQDPETYYERYIVRDLDEEGHIKFAKYVEDLVTEDYGEKISYIDPSEIDLGFGGSSGGSDATHPSTGESDSHYLG